MNRIYDIQNFNITEKHISFELAGEKISLTLRQTGSKKLLKANNLQRQTFELLRRGLAFTGRFWMKICRLKDSCGAQSGMICLLRMNYRNGTSMKLKRKLVSLIVAADLTDFR